MLLTRRIPTQILFWEGKGCRKVHTKRYNKQVPSHHIQMDVKFLIFKDKAGKKVKRRA